MATGLFEATDPFQEEEAIEQSSTELPADEAESYYGLLSRQHQMGEARRERVEVEPGAEPSSLFSYRDSALSRYAASQQSDYGHVGDDVDRYRQAMEVGSSSIDESQVTPPWTKAVEMTPEGITGRDVVNFLFGPEMAILGARWDQEGWDWDLEIAKQMWVEHPFQSSLAAVSLVTTVIPGVNAVTKSMKVGTLAAKGIGKKSLLKEGFAGWDDQLRYMMGQVDHVTPEGNTAYRYFASADVEKLSAMAPEEALKAVGGPKYLKKLLLDEESYERFTRYTAEAVSGTANPVKKMWLYLHQQFGNTYAYALGDDIKRGYIDNLHDFFKSADFKTIFDPDAVIPEEHHLTWFKWMQGAIGDTAPEFRNLNPKMQEHFRKVGKIFEQHQKEALEEGMIDLATYRKVGKRHVPVLYEGTPGLEVSDSVLQIRGALKPYRRPKVGSPTLEPRIKKPEEFIPLAEEGKLLIDPEKLSMTGYVRDRLLLNAYRLFRDLTLDAGIKKSNQKLAGHFIQLDDYTKLTPKQQAKWVDLNNLTENHASDILTRMISIKARKEGVEMPDRLPFISRQLFSELMEDGGMFNGIHHAANLMEVTSAIHKSMKTALNPATHFQNLAGNLFAFLPMAGYNVFTAEHINDGKMLSQLMSFISDAKYKKGFKAEDLFGVKGRIQGLLEEAAQETGKKGQRARELLEWSTQVNSNSGARFNLLDELSDPTVSELVEFSAFDNVEGLSHLQDMFQNMMAAVEAGKQNVGAMSQLLAKAFLKAGGVGQESKAGGKILKKLGIDLGGKTLRETTLHKMSALYLQEDIVPKMMYYLDLRRKAFNIQNATFEVGRRLPQYKRVGPALSRSRKYFLPWVTFPAETARIMKNNLMDHPLLAMPFLQMPSIVQGLFSATGVGPGLDEVEAAKDMAPAWANKPTATILEGGGKAGSVLGGLAGAFTGSVGGALSYGGLGALVGAAGGGALGAALGYSMTKDEKAMRSWVLDFLPHSSLMPATTAEHVVEGLSPIRAAWDITPMEPLAVLMPLIRVVTGKGSFGQEIHVDGIPDAISKMSLGLFGFLSPPIIQKYGMYVGEPQRGLLYLGNDYSFDIGTAALAGGAAALAGGGLLGGSVAFGAGGLIGTNTVRLGQELGTEVNPRTGEYGNAFLDFWMKSFIGTTKSWKATPEQGLFNESLQRGRFTELRAQYQRRMDDAVANGRDHDFKLAIGDIYRTFSKEYRDNPVKAQNKFKEYMERRLDKVGRHPSLKNWSEEQLRERLRQASDFAAGTRSQVKNAIMEAVLAELRNRGGGDVGGYDIDFGLDGKPLFDREDLFKPKKRKKSGLFE